LKLQVTVGGKTYEVEVEVLEEDESPRQPQYGSYQPAPATSHPMPVSNAHEGQHENEGKFCLSPVTGLVIRVQVEPGQAVEASDPIMVLEAMKMETNVTAPHAGVVKKVHVAQGDSVKVNQVLVEFE
jgi:methylmalonyl-CoA carboxyltransferase small subunit